MIRKIAGRKAYFCTEACAEGFREDRRYGVIYASAPYMNREAWSIGEGRCAYCNGHDHTESCNRCLNDAGACCYE